MRLVESGNCWAACFLRVVLPGCRAVLPAYWCVVGATCQTISPFCILPVVLPYPAVRCPALLCPAASAACLPDRPPCTAADEKAGIVYCEMDFAQLAERRANMPLRQQKRGDLYSLLDLTR